ncbi:MAG TPA: PspC domain-containing protein [Vicinamibacterales bacterium]|jgi:phage shock protein PspC (stress-responsive transcriptional regulator)
MQKVVAINLNGRAYHVEEPGYDALVAYLDRAGARLADNPDRAEILADLEQAIADKCERLLGPHKTVVGSAEIDRILTEMGPVDAGASDTAAAGDAAAAGEKAAGAGGATRRLYQIREGAMISGLCTGLAAYLDIDVTFVRVAFVALAVLTRGAWLLVYGVLMFVIPYAETSEERAAARGRPFTAQALIDQTKRNYANFRNHKDWKRHWWRQQREWKRRWLYTTAPHTWSAGSSYASQVWSTATAPVFGLISAAMGLMLVFALFSLATTQSVLGVPLPTGVPLWAGFVIVIGIYQVIAMPFIAAHRTASRPGPPGLLLWMSPVSNLLWMGAIGYSLWYGYHHVPAVHDAIDAVITTLRHTAAEMPEK